MTVKAKYFLAFAVFGASLAAAKSYQITLDSPSKVGNMELKRGQYAIAVDASKVRFVDSSSGKSIETSGTIINTQKKYKDTVVNTKTVNGTSQIQEIELGGTSTKIQFE